MSISKVRFLDIIVESAKIFVPTENLTKEQLEAYDNIEYGFTHLKEPVGIAWYEKNRFAINDKNVRYLASEKPLISGILLDLIQTALHEIVHILFPGDTEKQVHERTVEWLNSYNWGSLEAILP
ncbi:MAG: hypothetical protein NWE88_07040 [Candidatus Bathyarchaeota archaeon]|nr:hypothetical protein [Candidatus Bathyarchaeota archaeon]